MKHFLSQSELGKKSTYEARYNPNKLFPISRKTKRKELGLFEKLPFFGFDLWNHYEVSWLDLKGKPIVATAEICYDCTTPFIVESKSMKLYFNSFNHDQFESIETIQALIQKDIEQCVQGKVTVNITPLCHLPASELFSRMAGECLDQLNISCSNYTVLPALLKTEDEFVEETLYSHLLKSNCLITSQPDWGSVQITYRGQKINHEGLLRYIVSYRNHNEFHEQCIERIFTDIMRHCQPQTLTVYGRYTRRGGLDINPYRSTERCENIPNKRLWRQ